MSQEQAKEAIQELAGNGDVPVSDDAANMSIQVKGTLNCGVPVTGSASVSQEYYEAVEDMAAQKKIANEPLGHFDQASKVAAAERFNLHKKHQESEANKLLKSSYAVNPYEIENPVERAQAIRDQRAKAKAALKSADQI